MIKLIDRHASKLATVVLAGGLSLALSACTPGHAVNETSSRVSVESQEAQGRVEAHIQQLHDKLHITRAQEPQFEAVADVIRSNEARIHGLVERRHATENENAIEDLQSYKEIADAHAEGVARLIPVFEDLYDTMSPAQKANADKVFGSYEGRWHRHKAWKAQKKKAAQ